MLKCFVYAALETKRSIVMIISYSRQGNTVTLIADNTNFCSDGGEIAVKNRNYWSCKHSC